MKKRTLQVLSLLWLAALILGSWGMWERFTLGEKLTGYGSYVPWGLWVALYFHAVGISGGVFLAGVLGYFLRIKGLRENLRVTLWVSGISLVTGFFAIWVDLGKPFRAHEIFTSPSFTSMLAFNSWMYGVFVLVAAACFFLSLNKKNASDTNDASGWLSPLLLVGIALAVVFPSQSGVVFGVVEAKPYWTTALMPFLFLVSGVTAGSAALLLVHTFLMKEDFLTKAEPITFLRRISLLGLITYFVLEFAEYSIAFWSPASQSRESIELVLFGPFWWVFWLVHVGGGIIAVILLSGNRKMPAVGTGAFIIAITFVACRLNILIPGQAVSELKGLGEAFKHSRLTFFYEATPHEYRVALFLGAFGVGLVFLGIAFIRKFIDNRKMGSLS